jgi:SagB-type dehydrogenase family enzyme
VPQAGPDTDTTRRSLEQVYRYHDGTKHHFERFARSLGYLDWASQPRPFRAFAGTVTFPLYPSPEAADGRYEPPPVTYDEALRLDVTAAPLGSAAIGDIFRHSLGLSAWKAFKASRWSLRVNPSSGNLHPTEAYLISPALPGLAGTPAVYHYLPDRHVVELRCVLDSDAWTDALAGRSDVVLIALTSIQWREAWKYGERAFRYCQHDLGHAIAAVSMAAAAVGWHARLLPAWSHHAIAAITGIDREDDFVEAEREDAGCVLALGRSPIECSTDAVDTLVAAARRGAWSGRASQLSEDHVTWSFIDEVSRATEDPGRSNLTPLPSSLSSDGMRRNQQIDVRRLVRQRRSALAFDARSTIDRVAFVDMLSRTLPAAVAPLAALWWTPRVHLALFVHRVDRVAPGVYMLVRDPQSLDRLRAACRADFLWERADPVLPLWLLAPADVRALSARLSCDQDIAADGFFSLGMLADFDASLETFGPSFYRHLYWETGIVGQILYLEAEAAGARATGIGCFYDDPVHRVLGLNGHAFQSLYHFTVGQPVEDMRLTTEPGYVWETGRPTSA